LSKTAIRDIRNGAHRQVGLPSSKGRGWAATFASAGRVTRLSTNLEKGMAGRCVQGVIDVLVGNYGGNPADVPYVVNKEAFR
jgi:hypothetical protein